MSSMLRQQTGTDTGLDKMTTAQARGMLKGVHLSSR